MPPVLHTRQFQGHWTRTKTTLRAVFRDYNGLTCSAFPIYSFVVVVERIFILFRCCIFCNFVKYYFYYTGKVLFWNNKIFVYYKIKCAISRSSTLFSIFFYVTRPANMLTSHLMVRPYRSMSTRLPNQANRVLYPWLFQGDFTTLLTKVI